MLVLDHITDGGHRYLKVPVSLVEELGVASLISSYSVICPRGNWYLEEDQDMGIFLDAYIAKHGCKPYFAFLNCYTWYSPHFRWRDGGSQLVPGAMGYHIWVSKKEVLARAQERAEQLANLRARQASWTTH